MLARDYMPLFEIENTTLASELFRFPFFLFFSFFPPSSAGRENGITVILDSLDVNPDYESRGEEAEAENGTTKKRAEYGNFS